MTEIPVAHRGRCPHCGAELLFHVGTSRSVVCEYCHTLVARRGSGYEELGKVADLIPTGTMIGLGDTGRFEDASFRVVGRLQYQWQQGAWDEWYLTLSDGRWGWLAEAQGRYYVLFRKAPRKVPPAEQAVAGATIIIDGLGKHVVTDIKEATIVTAAGELPDEVKLGSTPYTVDLEGLRGSFITFDYGDRSEPPVVFAGRQIPLADLALEDTSGRAMKRGEAPVATDKLKCPQCQGPIEIRVPGQTVRLVCEYCNALLDTSQGPLQLLAMLDRLESPPPLSLGTKGTLRGVECLVVGYMRRSCVVEGVRYPWDELLLYQPQSTGFSWLVRSDGHWQLAEAISAAEVSVSSKASYKGRRYRLFSTVNANVEAVLGEFYWAVGVGDQAAVEDYIAPPEGLSREATGREVNWSHLTHLTAAEVADAFNAPDLKTDAVVGVGAIEPNRYETPARELNRWVFVAMGLALLLSMYAAFNHGEVFNVTLSPEELTADATPADPNRRLHSYLSPPFDLTSRRAIGVWSRANVANSWVVVSGAVIPSSGGDSEPFDLESSYYSGTEGGESWSEGTTLAHEELAAVPGGEYVLRADIEWDPKLPAPPPVLLTVSQGGMSFWQLFFVLLGLALPLLLNLLRQQFEQERWENATMPFNGWGSN
jgi:hypothetical protein